MFFKKAQKSSWIIQGVTLSLDEIYNDHFSQLAEFIAEFELGDLKSLNPKKLANALTKEKRDLFLNEVVFYHQDTRAIDWGKVPLDTTAEMIRFFFVENKTLNMMWHELERRLSSMVEQLVTGLNGLAGSINSGSPAAATSKRPNGSEKTSPPSE